MQRTPYFYLSIPLKSANTTGASEYSVHIDIQGMITCTQQVCKKSYWEICVGNMDSPEKGIDLLQYNYCHLFVLPYGTIHLSYTGLSGCRRATKEKAYIVQTLVDLFVVLWRFALCHTPDHGEERKINMRWKSFRNLQTATVPMMIPYKLCY